MTVLWITTVWVGAAWTVIACLRLAEAIADTHREPPL